MSFLMPVIRLDPDHLLESCTETEILINPSLIAHIGPGHQPPGIFPRDCVVVYIGRDRVWIKGTLEEFFARYADYVRKGFTP